MTDGYSFLHSGDKHTFPHKVAYPVRAVPRLLLPAQTKLCIPHRSAFIIAVLDFDVQAAMTVLFLPKILTGAFVFRFLFLLAGTKAIVGLDALPEVLDKTLIWVQHNTH